MSGARDRSARDTLRWGAAGAIAAALHGALLLPLLAKAPSTDLSMEDVGAMMSVSLADLPTAPDEGDMAAQDAAPAPPAAAAAEVDEALSNKAEREVPTADAAPVTPPPDLQVAQQETRKTQDEEQRRQTTEAQEAIPEETSAPAAASTAAAPAPVAVSDAIAAAADGSTDKASRVVESWQRSVLAHLGRHKRYPAEARSRGIEGEVRLAFTVDRAGRIVTAMLMRPSGVPALDREALDMLARAQPLPPLPVLATPDQGRLVVPVRYRLK